MHIGSLGNRGSRSTPVPLARRSALRSCNIGAALVAPPDPINAAREWFAPFSAHADKQLGHLVSTATFRASPRRRQRSQSIPLSPNRVCRGNLKSSFAPIAQAVRHLGERRAIRDVSNFFACDTHVIERPEFGRLLADTKPKGHRFSGAWRRVVIAECYTRGGGDRARHRRLSGLGVSILRLDAAAQIRHGIDERELRIARRKVELVARLRRVDPPEVFSHFDADPIDGRLSAAPAV